MKLIFLGPPGAGKGTQAAWVSQRFAVPHISTGTMLRTAVANETATGLEAKKYMEAGQLVPDTVLIAMVKERINEPDCANGYLLDGFPRTVAQAEALETICAPDYVVDIDVADEKILNRLTGRRVCSKCEATYHISTLNGKTVCEKCGGELIQRADDKPETIRKRLDVYAAQTSPLIDFYKNLDRLVVINGDQPVEKVLNEIVEALQA